MLITAFSNLKISEMSTSCNDSATGNGHEIVDSEEEADAIVINTCCFIHDAKEESISSESARFLSQPSDINNIFIYSPDRRNQKT